MKNVIKKFLNKLKVVCVTLLCMAQTVGAEGIQVVILRRIQMAI